MSFPRHLSGIRRPSGGRRFPRLLGDSPRSPPSGGGTPRESPPEDRPSSPHTVHPRPAPPAQRGEATGRTEGAARPRPRGGDEGRSGYPTAWAGVEAIAPRNRRPTPRRPGRKDGATAPVHAPARRPGRLSPSRAAPPAPRGPPGGA